MTRMTDIDDLMPDLMRYAPNLPEPTAHRFLLEAAREWCQRTKCWRETDKFTISTTDGFALNTIPDADVHYIDEGEIDGAALEPIPLETLDEKVPRWLWQEEEGQARYITQIEPETAILYPRQKGVLKCRYVLQPSLSAETVPLFLAEKFGQYIGLGASARALTMPDVEYSNPNLGQLHGSQFERRMRQYSGVISRGQQRGRTRTKASFF